MQDFLREARMQVSILLSKRHCTIKPWHMTRLNTERIGKVALLLTLKPSGEQAAGILFPRVWSLGSWEHDPSH